MVSRPAQIRRLGFERMVMYVTGMANIRDVLPFPRTTGSLEM